MQRADRLGAGHLYVNKYFLIEFFLVERLLAMAPRYPLLYSGGDLDVIVRRTKGTFMKVFILSPHSDDVALSMGGMVARLALDELVIVNCFGTSCFTDLSDTRATTDMRRRSEEAYAEYLGAELIWLGLPDTNVRGEMGKRTLEFNEESALRRELRRRLLEIVPRDSQVYAPLGIGGHADHLHCRDVARMIFTSVIYYEDQPYSQMLGGPTATCRTAYQLLPGLRTYEVELDPRELANKTTGWRFYSTYVPEAWGEGAIAYASALGMKRPVERYWIQSVMEDTDPACASANEMPKAPIVFIHYGDSYYLQHTLRAAVKFNPDKKVVLLGDSSNAQYRRLGVEHVHFSDFEGGEALEAFDNVYQYIAGDELRRPDWVQFVFRRWFLMHNFLESRKYERFWTFDSDTLIVSQLASREARFSHVDCTEQCSGICMNGLINNLRVVRSYLRVINALFKNEEFLQEQRKRVRTKSDYAFTEMAAYVAFRDRTPIRTMRLGEVIEGETFLDCLCTVAEHREYLDDDHYELHGKRVWGHDVKRLYLGSDGTIYAKRRISRELVRLNTINLSWIPRDIYETLASHSERQLASGKLATKLARWFVDGCCGASKKHSPSQPELPRMRILSVTHRSH
jgi:LmbE family N-acetylglucosaminyl deacetylase